MLAVSKLITKVGGKGSGFVLLCEKCFHSYAKIWLGNEFPRTREKQKLKLCTQNRLKVMTNSVISPPSPTTLTSLQSLIPLFCRVAVFGNPNM